MVQTDLRIEDHVYPVLDDVLSLLAEKVEDLLHVGFVRKTPKPDAILQCARGDHLRQEHRLGTPCWL